jgi:hypothetical protein
MGTSANFACTRSQSTILELLRNEHLLASVLLIQKTWRCYSARSHFAALRKGAITAQTRTWPSSFLSSPRPR